MEGVGSRQSRASSRYSSSPSAPVFNGPVRKWKKQWVSSRSTTQNNGGGGGNRNRNDTAPLLLCRWTPISTTASAEEPRKRRFRYTPIVPIEKGKVEGVEKVSNEAGNNSNSNSNSKNGRYTNTRSMLEKPGSGDISGEDTTAQDLNEDQADSNNNGATPALSG